MDWRSFVVVDIPRNKTNISQAPIRPEANYNSKTGQPDTTGAGDLGTLRARASVLGLGQRTRAS